MFDTNLRKNFQFFQPASCSSPPPTPHPTPTPPWAQQQHRMTKIKCPSHRVCANQHVSTSRSSLRNSHQKDGKERAKLSVRADFQSGNPTWKQASFRSFELSQKDVTFLVNECTTLWHDHGRLLP